MHKFPLALVAVLGIPLTLATGAVAQTAPPNVPIAVMCYAEQDQSWRVGYLSRVMANGDALYLTSDGRLSATVNAKGLVMPPADRPVGVDCYGKTWTNFAGAVDWWSPSARNSAWLIDVRSSPARM